MIVGLNRVCFNEKNEALEYFKNSLFEKFRFDVSDILNKSRLLDVIKQKKIFDF